MNIATPLRFCAALALLLGGSSIASAAAPTSETSINPKGGSVLVFTDLHSAAVPEAPRSIGSTAIPEPASTGVVCLGLAAIACHFRRRSKA